MPFANCFYICICSLSGIDFCVWCEIRNLILFLTWLSSGPRTFSFSSLQCYCLHKLSDCICVALFLDYFIPLVSFLVQILHNLDYYNFIMNIWKWKSSNFVLFQDRLTYSWSFAFSYIYFRITLLIFTKKYLNFD